jgi:hypothetical protein
MLRGLAHPEIVHRRERLRVLGLEHVQEVEIGDHILARKAGQQRSLRVVVEGKPDQVEATVRQE